MDLAKSRLLFIGCLILPLVGCGSDSGDNVDTGTAEGNTNTPVAQVISQAEAEGLVPPLDFGEELPGPDEDGNGIRDDIDDYIDGLPDTAMQKAALRQLAREIQATMLAGTRDVENEEVRRLSDDLARSMSCMYVAYGSDGRSERIGEVQRYTLNTFPRLRASNQFDEKIDGHVLTLPKGEVCDA